MKIYIYIVLVGVGIFCGAVYMRAATAEQFIVAPKKKNVSINTLKEECCQACGDLLSLLPNALHTIADLQSASAQIIAGYWESDKQSFCMKADRQQLTTCLERLENIKAEYEKLDTALVEELQGLKRVITTQ